MPKSALRVAVGACAVVATLAAAAPAGAAVTTLPGSYSEAPYLSVGSAAGRVWFSAYAIQAKGGDQSGRSAASRITSAKISKGNLTSLVTTSLGNVARFSSGRQPVVGNSVVVQRPDGSASRGTLKTNGRVSALAAVAGPPTPIMDAAFVGAKLVLLGGTNLVVCCTPSGPVSLGAVQGGFANDAVLRRDKGGRLWAAWDAYAGFGAAGTNVRMQQLNPATLQPVGAIQVAPVAYPAGADAPAVALACAATCRVVFTGQNGKVLSWKPGEARATTIAGSSKLFVGAVATASGKVVTAYIAGGKLQVRRGGSTGSGGKVKKVTLANGQYAGGAVALAGSRLAVVLGAAKGANWRAVGMTVAIP